MADFTTAQGEYVWCGQTLKLLCSELLQSEPTEVTVTLAAPDVNYPVSTCMYPGKIYKFFDEDREGGVKCSPPQLEQCCDEDLEAPDDAWYLWYLTFALHVDPFRPPASDVEQIVWGNFVDGLDEKDDDDENEQDGDGCAANCKHVIHALLPQEKSRCPLSQTWRQRFTLVEVAYRSCSFCFRSNAHVKCPVFKMIQHLLQERSNSTQAVRFDCPPGHCGSGDARLMSLGRMLWRCCRRIEIPDCLRNMALKTNQSLCLYVS